jgi:hypothetical protein
MVWNPMGSDTGTVEKDTVCGFCLASMWEGQISYPDATGQVFCCRSCRDRGVSPSLATYLDRFRRQRGEV